MKKFAALLILVLVSPFASAALITTDTTALTQTAQSYSTTVDLGGMSYTDVTLDLTAKGDYGYFSSERISFYIDGVLVANWRYNTPGISVVENVYAFDYTLSDTITISAALWESFVADGVLNITWQNGSEVDVYPVEGGADYVSYTLSGTLASVPEPAGIALLGLGLGMLGMSRRRRS